MVPTDANEPKARIGEQVMEVSAEKGTENEANTTANTQSGCTLIGIREQYIQRPSVWERRREYASKCALEASRYH